MLKKCRHCIEYGIAFVLIKMISILGIDKASAALGFIARKVGPYLPVTKTARSNLLHTLRPENVDKIIDQLWDNFGRFIGEMPYVRSLSDEEIKALVSIEGFEHVEACQKVGQPFLLFSGHLANWEFALRRIAPLMKLAVLNRKINNPYVDKLIKNIRSASGIDLISKDQTGTGPLMKAIRAKKNILMLVDQKMNEGISVPFLGKQAMTSYGIAKLAVKLKYPIIPAQVIRLEGAHFKIIFHPQLKLPKCADQSQCYYEIMCKINKILEAWVKEHPGQWFWFHNRWGKKDVFENAH